MQVLRSENYDAITSLVAGSSPEERTAFLVAACSESLEATVRILLWLDVRDPLQEAAGAASRSGLDALVTFAGTGEIQNGDMAIRAQVRKPLGAELIGRSDEVVAFQAKGRDEFKDLWHAIRLMKSYRLRSQVSKGPPPKGTMSLDLHRCGNPIGKVDRGLQVASC